MTLLSRNLAFGQLYVLYLPHTALTVLVGKAGKNDRVDILWADSIHFFYSLSAPQSCIIYMMILRLRHIQAFPASVSPASNPHCDDWGWDGRICPDSTGGGRHGVDQTSSRVAMEPVFAVVILPHCLTRTANVLDQLRAPTADGHMGQEVWC